MREDTVTLTPCSLGCHDQVVDGYGPKGEKLWHCSVCGVGVRVHVSPKAGEETTRRTVKTLPQFTIYPDPEPLPMKRPRKVDLVLWVIFGISAAFVALAAMGFAHCLIWLMDVISAEINRTPKG
jgi:hypothetical protein